MNTGQFLAQPVFSAGANALNNRHLLAGVMGCGVLELALLKDRDLSEDSIGKFWQLHSRLEHNEPLQYLLGTANFYGFELEVEPGVLIPRPETEGLVELALQNAKPGQSVLEIGTGSGCVAIALSLLGERLKLTATEISPAALGIAKKNIARHQARVEVLLADLFPASSARFDLIVSNPPYVSPEEYAQLEPQVRDNEPRLALLAGERGLEFYSRILARAGDYLLPGGLLLFEHGAGQREEIIALGAARGFEAVLQRQDLAGRDRYLGFCSNQ